VTKRRPARDTRAGKCHALLQTRITFTSKAAVGSEAMSNKYGYLKRGNYLARLIINGDLYEPLNRR
jgi:hypothetical protein